MNQPHAVFIVETKKESKAPRRVWRLMLPCATKDYRQVVSFNSFFNSIGRKNWKNKNKDWTLYVARDINEFNLFSRWCEFCPIENVDSLWDFYKIIGFDYKKRKYIK